MTGEKAESRGRKAEGQQPKTPAVGWAVAAKIGNGRNPVVTAHPPNWRHWLIATPFAVALTWYFWAPLWEGGTLIGGDLFPYFYPQKVFLAEQLKSGMIPLWNPLTGAGYPTIAESQTGVLYPPDLVAYRFLSVTSAYNTIQLSHYVLAFLGTFLLSQRLGCSLAGGLLAGVSFVYGWFPPRICLEWAIVTGAWLPWAIWCAESFLQTRRRGYLSALCGVMTCQLLAGHYHLAFLTQLTLLIYAPLRYWLRRSTWQMGIDVEPCPENASLAKPPSRKVRGDRGSDQIDSGERPARYAWLAIWIAMAISFLFAAVQLVPTWELKQRSQRMDFAAEFYPGYGHLPPQYWTQVIAPWLWYTHPVDELLVKLPNYSGGAGTNQVEAHLYFGLLPLLLAAGGLIASWRSRDELDRVLRLWALIGVAFLLYTPGWLLPITQYLPGFSFFRGPGRYGIITSLAVALLAGGAFSRLLGWVAARIRGAAKPQALGVVASMVIVVTTVELHWVAQRVGYSRMLPFPVVERRFDSPIRQLLRKESQPVRLLAPMANVANLLDVSSFPVYLGIGPEQYFDPRYALPIGAKPGLAPNGDPEQLDWLEETGVTHILALERMNSTAWPIELIWAGADPLLTPVFGRSSHEPFYLYRLRTATGRVVWETPHDAATTEITAYAAGRVELSCDTLSGGEVILRDLAYPGWRVTVDDQQRTAEAAGRFRTVTVEPGRHRIVWEYCPMSVYWGGAMSVVALVGALSASVLRRVLRRRNSITQTTKKL